MSTDIKHQETIIYECNEDKCKEVVREATTLIGTMGSISSGAVNLIMSTIGVFISIIVVLISLINLNLTLHIMFSSPVHVEDVIRSIRVILTIAFVVLLLCMTLITRLATFRATDLSIDIIAEILVNRESILECCKITLCRNLGNVLLCHDVDKLLNVIRRLKKLLRRHH